MTTFALINFEGVLSDTERDDIESALNITISSVRNITPISPDGMTPEEYAHTVVSNLLAPENEWPAGTSFIIRLPDAAPVFSCTFLIALEAAGNVPLAILHLQYTDDFPPEVDMEKTVAIPLQRIRKKALQLRYSTK